MECDLSMLFVVSVMHNLCQNKLSRKFQKKTIHNFKLHAVLSSVMRCPTVSLHPAWDVNRPWSCISMLYALSTCKLISSHLGYEIDFLSMIVLVLIQSLFFLIMSPKIEE